MADDELIRCALCPRLVDKVNQDGLCRWCVGDEIEDEEVEDDE